jgi:hypothetical protein
MPSRTLSLRYLSYGALSYTLSFLLHSPSLVTVDLTMCPTASPTPPRPEHLERRFTSYICFVTSNI